MSALLIPDFMFDAFSDVDPEFLKKQKITTLLCDIFSRSPTENGTARLHFGEFPFRAAQSLGEP